MHSVLCKSWVPKGPSITTFYILSDVRLYMTSSISDTHCPFIVVPNN